MLHLDYRHFRCRFTSLYEDIYRLILLELPTRDSLVLSMTCRSLREALSPAIFSRACVCVSNPRSLLIPEGFMPVSLRPHIQCVA